MSAVDYDAFLLVSFGGPEKNEDVMPFLDNILKGKPVSPERKQKIAGHYYHFDGVSPLNAQNKALIHAIKEELVKRSIDLPIYFGNRNWTPYLSDAFTQLAEEGKKKVLCLLTSVYSSFSGCRQYRNNLLDAKAELGERASFEYSLLRKFYNHPKFIECIAQRFHEQEKKTGLLCTDKRAKVIFTAHSIPMAMAQTCDYVKQLQESCRLVAEKLQIKTWDLVYQSRSGPPHIPWLEPDVCEHIETLKNNDDDIKTVFISPIGFISDHMEVIFDLDVEVKQKAQELALQFVRVESPGTHPLFVSMIVDLIEERLYPEKVERQAMGLYPAREDECPPNCCEWKKRTP